MYIYTVTATYVNYAWISFITWVEQCCMHISFLIKFTTVINKHAAFDYGFNHWYSCDEVLKWNKVERQLNKMKQNVIIQNEYYALHVY